VNAEKKALAVWALTPRGARLARRLAEALGDADVCLSTRVSDSATALVFERLSDALAMGFNRYRGHIFIMSTGIVVRMLAGLIVDKTSDPAVVVVDEAGSYAISLLAGHIGGANALAHQVASAIGAQPVITTATDLNQLPSVDVWAQRRGLAIENPGAVKSINMALLTGSDFWIHDPFDLALSEYPQVRRTVGIATEMGPAGKNLGPGPGIWIDDRVAALAPEVLVLRPSSLVVGLGCNRNTALDEIEDLLNQVCEKYKLAHASLSALASVDLKADEPGLLALAAARKLSMRFFSRDQLGRVAGIQNPSAMVTKHIGVPSVCEAAAILAADQGTLIVPKHKTANVTLAIARRDCILSASALEAPSTSPSGPPKY
jgi:cobalt-precorrin 5A hydrolase